ncbi:MAG TPA: DUF1799 domain-containing protein [Sideroxyarcus sp.]|nr:DUF1799 domain-containing protein [Sideroxyarcus sp.]
MGWEDAAWSLYLLVCTQWRTGSNGSRIGLDYNPAIAIMVNGGWDVALGIEFLQAIELEVMRVGKSTAA